MVVRATTNINMVVSDKSANQVYKEYKQDGGTLTFKAWLSREKAKGFINANGGSAAPVNTELNGDIASAVAQLDAEGGAQNTLTSKYIFGINSQVLLWVGIGLVVAVAGVIIYKKKMAKP